MGRLVYLRNQFDDPQSREEGPSDPGEGGSRGYATMGWRNRGAFFWIMLIIMIYWFILRPLVL